METWYIQRTTLNLNNRRRLKKRVSGNKKVRETSVQRNEVRTVEGGVILGGWTGIALIHYKKRAYSLEKIYRLPKKCLRPEEKVLKEEHDGKDENHIHIVTPMERSLKISRRKQRRIGTRGNQYQYDLKGKVEQTKQTTPLMSAF